MNKKIIKDRFIRIENEDRYIKMRVLKGYCHLEIKSKLLGSSSLFSIDKDLLYDFITEAKKFLEK